MSAAPVAAALCLVLGACSERALDLPPIDVADLRAGDLAARLDLAHDDLAVDPCVGLDEDSCLSSNLDCVADRCEDCTCGPPRFYACRGVDQVRVACPLIDCPLCCSSASPCQSPTPFCVAPGEQTPRCGICFMPANPCSGDAECAGQGAATICDGDPSGCLCASTCVPGCTSDGDCIESERCGPDHRCRPPTCAMGCPFDFVCGGGGACQRRACTIDAECSGHCVNGRCYAARGRCLPPPPP